MVESLLIALEKERALADGDSKMRERFKNYWHCAIPLLLFFPYYLINMYYLVNIFGCGCPKLDENMNLLPNQFNANNFTQVFWLLVALALVMISIMISRKIEDRKERLSYLVHSIPISIGLTFLCLLFSPMWM